MENIINLFAVKEVQILITFFVSLVISITAIPVIINISKLKDLMAEIELRSSHDELTPTLGGVAIFASTLISYFIWDNPNEGHEIHLAISSIIILFFLGIKDDILILSPKKKLLIQIAASILLIIFGEMRISHFYGLLGVTEIPYIISVLFTTFIFISVINAINLIDGIDGLAGTVGLLASLTFGYLFYDLKLYALSTLSIGLAGSLIGFLRFNWSVKNKIFMGDTGSLILGFLLSFFAVKYIIFNSSYRYNPQLGVDAPILMIILLIIPLFDTLRMFSIRLLAGKSPFKGDRNHLHHLLIDTGLSHFWATMTLVIFNLVVLFTYISVRQNFTNNQAIFGLFIVFLIYCLSAYLLSERINSAKIERIQFTKIDKLKRLQIVEEKKNQGLINQNTK